MNGTMQQIVSACVPVLCLLITAGGAYAVALLRRETARLQKEIDNETANKYMDMAVDAVEQAVASTAQTFVDALKSSGGFTKEKQLEAFQKSRDKVLEILGDTAVAALNEIYGDFDAWIDTKIEQVCRDLKRPDNGETATTAATTAAATAASVATTIAATTVQQLAGEVPASESTVEVEIETDTGNN